MSGVSYTIEVDGLENVRSSIARLGLTPADTLAPRKDIAEEGRKRVSHYFETGTAPDGTKWPESGRAKRDGGQTLLDKGQMRDLVHWEATDDGDVEGSTNDIRARVHNEGLLIEAKNAPFLVFAGADGKLVMVKSVQMPKRTFLDEHIFDNDDYIESTFHKYFEQRFEG
jgi:phage gpG-like protein